MIHDVLQPTEIAFRHSSSVAHLYARLVRGSKAWVNSQDLLPFAWFLLIDFFLAIAIDDATSHVQSSAKKYRTWSQKKLSGRRFKTRSVGLVEAETFFFFVWPYGVLVSRPFSAFEKKALKFRGILAGAPDHAAGTKQTNVNDVEAKWRGHGRAMVKVKLDRMHGVFLYATRYGYCYSVGSTLVERVWRFSGSRMAIMGKRLFCCSLSRTTTPALWVSVLVVGKEAYARDAKDEQRTFLWGLVDTSNSATTTSSPIGQVMTASPTTTWAGCIFFACLSMSQDRTTTYTGWRHARQQPDFLLLFGTCGDSLSGTTTGDGAAGWIKTIILSSSFSSTSNRRTALKLRTRGLQGLRNTVVQKY